MEWAARSPGHCPADAAGATQLNCHCDNEKEFGKAFSAKIINASPFRRGISQLFSFLTGHLAPAAAAAAAAEVMLKRS
jgi:hypothetical protein